MPDLRLESVILGYTTTCLNSRREYQTKRELALITKALIETGVAGEGHSDLCRIFLHPTPFGPSSLLHISRGPAWTSLLPTFVLRILTHSRSFNPASSKNGISPAAKATRGSTRNQLDPGQPSTGSDALLSRSTSLQNSHKF